MIQDYQDPNRYVSRIVQRWFVVRLLALHHVIVLWNASRPKAQCILSPLGEQDKPLMEACTEYEISLTIIQTLTSIVLHNSAGAWGCNFGKSSDDSSEEDNMVIMPSSPYHSHVLQQHGSQTARMFVLDQHGKA